MDLSEGKIWTVKRSYKKTELKYKFNIEKIDTNVILYKYKYKIGG